MKNKLIRLSGIMFFALITLNFVFFPFAYPCGYKQKINVDVLSDKSQYQTGENAHFNITLTGLNGRLLPNIKRNQIVASFPDEDTIVELTPISKGTYAYQTAALNTPGQSRLSISVYDKGVLDDIKRLQAKKERLLKEISELKERKAGKHKHIKHHRRTDNSRKIIILQRLIAKIDAAIEELKKKCLIGYGFRVIEVLGGNDTIPPLISEFSPAEEAALNQRKPVISCVFSDNSSGINTQSVTFFFDDQDLTSQAVITANGLSFTPAEDLNEDWHWISITAADNAGNTAESYWEFCIDMTPADIQIVEPADGSLTPTLTPYFEVDYSDDISGCDISTLKISINDTEYTSYFTIEDTYAFWQVPEEMPFSEGEYSITASLKDFAGNTAHAVSYFKLTTTIPPETDETAGFIHGVVYDAQTGQVLPGAKVTCRGVEGAIVTDTDGKFSYPVINFPEENQKSVIIEIHTTGYILAQRKVVVTATRDVSVEPVYLKPADAKITAIDSQGGVAANSDGTIEMVFPQGAVSETINAGATLYNKGRELPGPLPQTSFFTYACDLHPDGVTFSQPVTIKLANSRGFAAGLPIPVGYYNKDTASWHHETMAHVTADSQWVEFQVAHFSPYDINFPVVPPAGSKNPLPDVVTNKEGNGAVEPARDPGVGVRSGSLLLEYDIPLIKSLGQLSQLKFTYASNSASPSAFIGTETTIGGTKIPALSGFALQIEGLRKEVKFVPTDQLSRQSFLFDCKNARGQVLKTGSYPYTLSLSNDYFVDYYTTSSFGGAPENPTGIRAEVALAASTDVQGRIIVNNQIDSPFGAGWNIAGIEKLYRDPDGKYLVIDGNGSSYQFNVGYTGSSNVFAYGPAGLLAFDEQGNLYSTALTDAYVSQQEEEISLGLGVYKITPQGKVYNGIYNPWSYLPFSAGIKAGHDGFIYAAAAGSIAKISPQETIQDSYTYSAGQEIYASGMNNLSGLAIDANNVIYAASGDTNGQAVIYRVPYANAVPEIFASGFSVIADMAFDDKGVLYAAAQDGIWKIDSAGQAVLTYPLPRPYGMAFDREGNLYTACQGDNSLYRIAPDGKKKLICSGFNRPGGVAIDSFGNVYVANEGGFHLVKISINGSLVYISTAGDYSTLTHTMDDDTYTHTFKNGTKFNFDQNGRHISTVDRNNNMTTYTYNEAGCLASIIDPAGHVTTLTYTNGKLFSITDSAGKTTRFNIDTKGDLVSITAADGSVTSYAYNDSHLINSVIDPLNQTTAYSRNNHARYNKITFPNGDVIDFILSETTGLINDIPEGSGTAENPAAPAAGNTTDAIKNARGFTTQYLTDSFGSIIQETDPLGNVKKIERDADSNPVKIINPKGNTKEMEYDGQGNLVKVTEKSGGGLPDIVTRYTYEPRFNFIKTITDPKGSVTTYYYDYEETTLGDLNGDSVTNQSGGNLVKVVLPSPLTSDPCPFVLFTYNNRGQPLTAVNPVGIVTKYEYDDATGYVIKITNDYGDSTHVNAQTQYAYDAAGNVVSVTDSLNHITLFSYDAFNRLTESIVHSPQSIDIKTKYTYDKNSNLIKLEKQANEVGTEWQTIEYKYDNRQRLIETIEGKNTPDERRTAYEYDQSNNKIKTIDAQGHETAYTYEERDLLQSVTDAVNNLTEYSYDPNKNLQQIKDAKGNSTQYEYDGFDRLIKTMYPDPISGGTNNSFEQYFYDNNSNLIAKQTRKGDTISYAYDALNRLTQKAYPDTSSVSYSYDALNRLTLIAQGSVPIVQYTYDALNRVVSSDYTLNTIRYTLGYEYDKAGNRTKLTYPDNTWVTYNYDGLNRLTNIKDQTAANIASYSYDVLSRRTGLTYLNGLSTSYVYDNLNRLTTLTNPSVFTNPTRTYTYDKVGNALTMATAEGTHGYTYDNIYQLTGVTYPTGYFAQSATYTFDKLGNRVTAEGKAFASNNLNQYTTVDSNALTYDLNGNLKTHSGWDYTYDWENRLIGATNGTTNTSYSFDAFGRRVSKTVNGTTTNFVYDGDQILAEYDSSGTLTKKFVYGVGVDEPIRLETNGQKYYYSFDRLGSVVGLTDSTGAKAEEYKFDVYGNVDTPSSVGNPYLFTGREFDQETGLYHYRARAYSPSLGRFLQTDPVDYFDSMNLYIYCSNDSVNDVDPYGLAGIKIGKYEVQIHTGHHGGKHLQVFEKGNLLGRFKPDGTPISHMGKIPAMPTGLAKALRKAGLLALGAGVFMDLMSGKSFANTIGDTIEGIVDPFGILGGEVAKDDVIPQNGTKCSSGNNKKGANEK